MSNVVTEKKSGKGRVRTERVQLMIDNFFQEFQSGLTPDQIEEKYGVSSGYWRKFVDEIADNNHVDKEIFFQRNHGSHVLTDNSGRIIPKKASMLELEELLTEAEDLLKKTEKVFLKLEKDTSEMLALMEMELNKEER